MGPLKSESIESLLRVKKVFAPWCASKAGRVSVGSPKNTSVMKTTTLSTDDPAQEGLLQKYQEPVDRQSQQNSVIKILY